MLDFCKGFISGANLLESASVFFVSAGFNISTGRGLSLFGFVILL